MEQAIKDEIDKLAKIMAETVPVKKIYLFGSYAYGTPHKDSDLDFYVVLKPGVEMRSFDAVVKMRTAMYYAKTMPIDVLAETHDYFMQEAALPTLEKKIARDGIVVYEEAL